jgi:hypothetical protein
MGIVGAGGAALILEASGDDDRQLQSAGDDQRQETTYPLAGFDEVSIVGPQDVDIVLGEAFAVTASGSNDDLRQLEAVVENGVLVIRPREGHFGGDRGDLDEVTFTVTMPAVTRVDLSGSGDVTVDRIAGDSFAGMIGGSGTLVIGHLETGEATFSVAGSGDLDASGAVPKLSVDISGSGAVHATGLHASDAAVAISGSGEADLTVLQQASVSITGSGEVDISGPGVCSVDRMGSGEVRCEGGGGEAD